MITLEVDRYKFSFTDAINAFKFDEKDKTMPMYHGAPMKGVDVVAEFSEAYIYIEIKDYDDLKICDIKAAENEEDKEAKKKHFRWLKSYLKEKYRDSYLYRNAENKVDKPIHYICLLNFDNAMNSTMKKALKHELPVGKPSARWITQIAHSCQVVNFNRWNLAYPQWPLTRISTGTPAVG